MKRNKSFGVTGAIQKAIHGRVQAAWFDPKGRWAVTDSIGSYPAYYAPNHPEAGFSPDPWSFGKQKTSPHAWKSFCAFGGLVTSQAFPLGVRKMEPNQAGWVTNRKYQLRSFPAQRYRFSSSETGDLKKAAQRVFSIGVEYLRQRLSREKNVILFFSSGSDSLLVALMLRDAGISFRAVTADYGWERYSEYPAAQKAAQCIGIPLERVPLRGRDYWSSFLGIHSALQDCPCGNASSMVWHALAIKSLKGQRGVVVTGDHADSLFLGFEEMHRQMPNHPEEYWKKERRMSLAEKCARALPLAQKPDQPELEKLGGVQSVEVERFLRNTVAARRKELGKSPGGRDLPTLQQRAGQIRAGIPWQHNFLFVERALPGVRFVSPFYDPKMIQFALAIKPEIKAGNGQPKSVVHFLVREKTGKTVSKRASPFPLRIWTLLMPFYLARKIPASARGVFLMAWLRNLACLGRNYTRLLSLAAALLWKKRISGLSV